MATETFLRKAHRIIAVLFLLSIPPAFIASFTSSTVSPVVYLPLFPLLGLTLTGTYFLIKPWLPRRKAH